MAESFLLPALPLGHRFSFRWAILFSRHHFSPDSDYSTLRGPNRVDWHALPGRLPGSPRKIKEGVEGPITFSPNGDLFSFVRANEASGDYSLITTGVDGASEHVIATRQQGQTFPSRTCLVT